MRTASLKNTFVARRVKQPSQLLKLLLQKKVKNLQTALRKGMNFIFLALEWLKLKK